MIERGKVTGINDLPFNNKYDGLTKFYTNECPGCEGYLQLPDGEVCLLGRAWKRLSREGKILNTCTLLKKVEKKREIENAPKLPVIIYTPNFLDFIGDTEEWLISMGFTTRYVKSGEEHPPGFSIEF
jgi:hypothetical protein